MMTAAIIYALTYVIISGRRLQFIKIGRPAGVMLGAVLMVGARVITPADAYRLVDWNTIVLLFGMMIIIEHLADAEFFELFADRIARSNLSERGILSIVVFVVGGLAAFLVNDIVCIFFTPLLVAMIRQRRLAPLPFLLALATSTNLGGLIAFTGNPQNMIIGNLSGLSYARFFLLMLPVGLLTLAVNYGLLLLMFGDRLSSSHAKAVTGARVPGKPLLKRSLLVAALVIVGFFAGGNMAWVALSGATLLLLLAMRHESSVINRIDWNLLLFFAGLFVVVGALQMSGATTLILNAADRFIKGEGPLAFWSFGVITVVFSNLFANVPYVLVAATWIEKLQNPELMWYVLAFASTVAGNLTLIGAIANLIVTERAKAVCEISFWDFFRFGLPSTVANFVLGMGVLWLYHSLHLI